MRLILYSKPGCHLCEGLQEKLKQIDSIPFELEVRDITTRDDWFQAYQYEIPVIFLEKTSLASANGSILSDALIPLPRPSPRASIQQLEQLLQKYVEM
jgi:glutaredoxin